MKHPPRFDRAKVRTISSILKEYYGPKKFRSPWHQWLWLQSHLAEASALLTYFGNDIWAPFDWTPDGKPKRREDLPDYRLTPFELMVRLSSAEEYRVRRYVPA
jgi:hypothetical protein